MLEEIKRVLRKEPELSCYAVAKEIGREPTNPNVPKNYWKAKYELLLEQVQKEKSLQGTMSPENTASVESCHQEGVPDQWTDSEGAFYVKGTKSGIWRVYPNGLEFGYWEDIDEHKVKARYAMEIFKK